MTTKELAETVLGKIVEYQSAEYSSISRSLRSLEKQGLIQRVQVKLKWRLKTWNPSKSFYFIVKKAKIKIQKGELHLQAKEKGKEKTCRRAFP